MNREAERSYIAIIEGQSALLQKQRDLIKSFMKEKLAQQELMRSVLHAAEAGLPEPHSETFKPFAAEIRSDMEENKKDMAARRQQLARMETDAEFFEAAVAERKRQLDDE